MDRDAVLGRFSRGLPDDDVLRRAVLDPAAAKALRADRAEVVLGAARRRATDAIGPVLWPLVTGWLVLATVWGFGRAAVPAMAGTFLLVGLAAAVVTASVGVRRRRRDRDLARAVVIALEAAGVEDAGRRAP